MRRALWGLRPGAAGARGDRAAQANLEPGARGYLLPLGMRRRRFAARSAGSSRCDSRHSASGRERGRRRRRASDAEVRQFDLASVASS